MEKVQRFSVKSYSRSEISWPCRYIYSRSSCICQITGQGRHLTCKNDDSAVINTFLICLHWYFRQIGIYNKWKWTHFMILFTNQNAVLFFFVSCSFKLYLWPSVSLKNNLIEANFSSESNSPSYFIVNYKC